MRKVLYTILGLGVAFGILSCDEQYTTYDDAEYILFADTLSTNMVLSDGTPFKVAVSSTVVRDYDRTVAVEVIDKGSNAIEGRHYRLESNTVTIPAGARSADVLVYGNYANIEAADSLGFTLQLVMPDELRWDLYEAHNRTKVVMYKSCPFDINNFAGEDAQHPRYCILTSMLLYNYPGQNISYQRLVRTYKHPSRENTIILDDMFYDGYDVTMTFLVDNPAEPFVTLDADQTISDEASVFGQILGDNKILCSESNYYDSYFSGCQNYVSLYVHIYVNHLATNIGTVGHYYNVLEWISDEEASEWIKQGF